MGQFRPCPKGNTQGHSFKSRDSKFPEFHYSRAWPRGRNPIQYP
ncbi:uncharacterized protein G2W53_017510 [Senna tora]|uniref:Uncharacterized protein n=1 Tax=Senna tora TaxID=362788 RepID=A0A834TSY5_9FABA|nr:uncharacterized protein G2W53_017510 [Senna tora]